MNRPRRNRPALFIEADTLVGPNQSGRQADPMRWRRYLPDAEVPRRMDSARIVPWRGGSDFVDDEPTGFSDMRQIVSGYPGVSPEKLTPYDSSPQELDTFPVAGAAILPSTAPARRSLRAWWVASAAVVLTVAATSSLLLSMS